MGSDISKILNAINGQLLSSNRTEMSVNSTFFAEKPHQANTTCTHNKMEQVIQTDKNGPQLSSHREDFSQYIQRDIQLNTDSHTGCTEIHIFDTLANKVIRQIDLAGNMHTK